MKSPRSAFSVLTLLLLAIAVASPSAKSAVGGNCIKNWNSGAAAGKKMLFRPQVIALPSLSSYTGSTAVKPDTGGGGDYLSDMLANQAKRWSTTRFPLRVFICDQDSAKTKSKNIQLAEAALNEWCRAAPNCFSWLSTADPQAADITVLFRTSCPRGVDSGDTKSTYDAAGHLNHASVIIATYQNGRTASLSELKKSCLHEIGHAFGLTHSSNPSDIMYWQSNQAQTGTLCARDLNTLLRLYASI